MAVVAALLMAPGVAHASGDGYPLPPPDVVDGDMEIERPGEVPDVVRVDDDVREDDADDADGTDDSVVAVDADGTDVAVDAVAVDAVAVDDSEGLPVTGADTLLLLAGAVSLALAGTGLLHTARRRRGGSGSAT